MVLPESLDRRTADTPAPLRVGLIIAMRCETPRMLASGAGLYHLGEIDVYLRYSGIGLRNAHREARWLCENWQPQLLLNTGFCGGVSPALQIGDLVVPDRVAHDGQVIALAASCPDSQWPDTELTLRSGLLQTFSRPVVSASAVPPGVLAVDMEGFAIAQVGRDYGIPTVLVKAVSDLVPLRPSVASLVRLVISLASRARPRQQLDEFCRRGFDASQPSLLPARQQSKVV